MEVVILVHIMYLAIASRIMDVGYSASAGGREGTSKMGMCGPSYIVGTVEI